MRVIPLPTCSPPLITESRVFDCKRNRCGFLGYQTATTGFQQVFDYT